MGAIPDGFAYVPEGRSLFGANCDEDLRRAFFGAAPAHQVWTSGFLIAKNETTYAEYIEFLDTLDPEEVELRRPRSDSSGLEGGFNVVRGEEGVWTVEWLRGDVAVRAAAGELFRYPGRKRRAEADWTRWPVGGISVEDAEAYTDWLDRSGRLPGARLCSEVEWERAARGAGDRVYPHGDAFDPEDANSELTYDRNPLGMGPDPVGSYPASRSPFGVDDMSGNVFEWTASTLAEGYVARGGSFFFGNLTVRAVNRAELDSGFRAPMLGVRVCATYTSAE
jgi:formylglycine-generating enzyme required for sulfatase activity